MNKERVLALVTMLEELGDREFQWNKWGNVVDDETFTYDESMYTEVKCGTTACVAGWAVLHPWFRERGLRGMGEVPQHEPVIGVEGATVSTVRRCFNISTSICPYYDGSYATDAMLKFLEIKDTDPVESDVVARWLDGPPSWKAIQVADSIRYDLKEAGCVWWNETIDLGYKSVIEDPNIIRAVMYTDGAD